MLNLNNCKASFLNESIYDYFTNFEYISTNLEYQTLNPSSFTLGIGLLSIPTHCGSSYGKNISLLCELRKQSKSDNLLYSPQLEFSINNGILFGGLKFNCSTDFNNKALYSIHPEIGIGLFIFFITYNHGFNLNSNEKIEIVSDQLTLKCAIPIISIK